MRMVPKFGALAQLGERLICIQEVRSSILLGSTKRLAQQGAKPWQCLREAKVTRRGSWPEAGPTKMGR